MGDTEPATELAPPTEFPVEELQFEEEEEDEEGNEIRDFRIEIESEGAEYTPLSTSEDPEKKAAYHDYKQLEKNIKYQNKILENLKDDIKQMERKPCLTKSEKCELKNLYECWNRELSKLQELLEKAIDLQNTGSKRHYREFPIVTTFVEDNLNHSHRICDTLQDQAKKTLKKSGNFGESAGESSETNLSSCSKGSQKSVSEEMKLVNKMLVVLKKCSDLKKRNQQKPRCFMPFKEEDSFEEIKSNIKCLQKAVGKCTEDLDKKEKTASNHELNQNPCDKPSTAAVDPVMLCFRRNLGKRNNFEGLKENYLYLLTECNKKDEQLRDLTQKLRNACPKCLGGGTGAGDAIASDEAELHLFQNRIKEMEEEQMEFMCLMKEQSVQLDEYRSKYLAAQQKVDEQCAVIEKLNMNNKCIEKQINQEVKEIRKKFQERIADLLQYPKLLENEQIKLAQACKEKEGLETKLVIVCKELKNLKSREQNTETSKSTNDEDDRTLLNKCQQELNQTKMNAEEMQRQRDMFCEQLERTVGDLNTLRSESAKIIARTKDRAEFIKQKQKAQIDHLEKQLAQCRAAASLSVSDRENVIKEMQGQLNTLSYSFDAAQKQIKTLRNHIAYISNENSFPAKI